jgi:DNA-binding MurR/RpiR family transcriptional regulator
MPFIPLHPQMQGIFAMAARTESSTWTSARAVERIRANLPQMPSAMGKIGELVLADPTAPIELSITELAERAGASAATVTRFCRLLGYAGYLQFRVALAGELGSGDVDSDSAWQTDIAREFGPDDTPAQMLSSLLSMHARAAQETASLIDLDTLEEVATTIWSARHVDIYGVGGSASLAAELQNRLYRIGISCHTWSEPHGGLVSAVMQDAGCVAIAISVSGRTVEVVDMLTQARTSGALTVAITSARDSALARTAEVAVITAPPNQYLQPGDLSTRPSQLLVLDLLYLLVARQDFPATASRLVSTRMAVSGHRRSTLDRALGGASA